MNIDFILPISAYSGLPVEAVVSAILGGTTRKDVLMSFQSMNGKTDGVDGFFYDYLNGLINRYPSLIQSINELREENGLNRIY